MTDLAVAPAVRWQNATIVRRVMQTPGIASFFVRPDRPFGWRAGQHVDVRLTAEDGYRAIRSYSIASLPVAGGEVEREVDAERGLSGAAVAVHHEVAALRDEDITVLAEQRIRARLVGRDELGKRDERCCHSARRLSISQRTGQ